MLTKIYNPRIDTYHQVKDLQVKVYRLHNAEGEVELVPCVEYLVIGNNREWVDHQIYRDFIAANPHVKI